MRVFRNFYQCPCGNEWTDTWTATCDDRCGECGTSCSPTESEDVPDEVELVGSPRPAVNIPASAYAGFAAVLAQVAPQCTPVPGEPEPALPYNQLSLFGDTDAAKD
jgi:hypothetical protein